MSKKEDKFEFKDLYVPFTDIKAMLLIIVIGFIVFGNALFNEFVWDDVENIAYNTLIHSISNIQQFFTGSTFNSGGQGILVGSYYKPFVTTIFSFIYTIFGDQTFFYHLIQISIHITNSILIFIFLRYYLNRWLAFFLSLVFLVHPMNVEAVSYLSALEDPVFFMFGMIALLLIKNNALKNKSIFFVFLFLLLSVLSKETGFLFVIALFIYVLLFKKSDLSKYIVVSSSIALLYFILRFAVAKIDISTLPVFAMTRLSFLERMKSLPEMLIFYIKNFFYPKDLAIMQDWTIVSINFQNFYFPLIISAAFYLGIFSTGFYLWKKKDKFFKPFIFFLTIYLLGIGIHLQIIPVDLTVADRWFYMSMMGLLGMIGLLIQKIISLYSSKRYFKLFMFALAVILISLLSIRTIARNADWKNEKTLYEHDIQINKNSYQLENNYGLILLREGKIHEGRSHVLRSTELAPYRWASWTSLAASYELEKDYENARKYYEIAMSRGPYYMAYQNYAKLLIFQDTPQNAQAFSKKAVEIFPYNSTLWLYLAVAEYKLGNKQAALEAAHRSYLLSPNDANLYVYNNLLNNQPIILE